MLIIQNEPNKSNDIIQFNNNIETFLSIVGETSTLSYFQISYALQSEVAILFKLKEKQRDKFYSHPQLLNVNLCHMLKKTEQLQLCIKFAEKQLPNLANSDSIKPLLPFWQCMSSFGKQSLANMISNGQEITHCFQQEISKNFCDFASHLLSYNRIDEALEYFKKSADEWKEIEEIMLQNETQTLKNSKLIPVSIGYKIDKSNCELILKEDKFDSNVHLMDHTTCRLLHNIANCLFHMNMFSEACIYLECAISFLDRLPPVYGSTSKIPEQHSFVNIWIKFGSCLIGQKEYIDGRKYLEKASNFFKSYPNIANSEKAFVGIEIAASYVEENKSTDYAVKNSETILQLVRSQSFSWNLSHKRFAINLYEIGKCLSEKLMFKQANQYTELSLDMMFKIFESLETNMDLANIHQLMGNSFLALNEFRKSIPILNYLYASTIRCLKRLNLTKLFLTTKFLLLTKTPPNEIKTNLNY